MTRPVRISPVPIPPPAVTARRSGPRTYGVLGAVLLLLGVLAAAGHLLVAGSGDRSWDAQASPPASVDLTTGTSYFVSTRDGPDVVPTTGVLQCTARPVDGGAGTPLRLTVVAAGSRATHAVASFVSPVTGTVSVTCSGATVGTRPVFVDDADGVGPDVAGLLLLASVVLLSAGAGAVLGAAYRRGRPHRPRDDDGPVSGVTA